MVKLDSQLVIACRAVHQGNILAHPTEAVWGLGCDPFNEQAVRDLCELKSRPLGKGLIVLVSNLDQAALVLGRVPPSLHTAVERDQDESLASRATSYIVEDTLNAVPLWVKGEHESIAIRVTQHKPLIDLLDQTGPLISTSANPSGKAPAKSIQDLEIYFGSELAVYSAPLGDAIAPSRIIELSTGKIIR